MEETYSHPWAHLETLQKRTLDHQINLDHMGKTQPNGTKHLNILSGERDTPENHSDGYTYTQVIQTVPLGQSDTPRKTEPRWTRQYTCLDPHRSLVMPEQGKRNSQ